MYWRKQHPNKSYSVAGPAAEYPEMLNRIQEWMQANQDLSPDPDKWLRASDQQPEVGRYGKLMFASQVRNRRLAAESDIRINYNDLTKIIAASNSISAAGTQAQFYSSDGGATWKQTTLPLVGSDNLHSDPAVDWTTDGTAWALTLGISATGNALRSYRSPDGGATWTLEATPSGSQSAVDREIIWVDHSPTSPFKDQIYATWHNGVPAFVATRTAAGIWQAPVQISGAEQTGPAIGNDIKTNSAGDVFVFYPDGDGSHKLRVVKSTNGGGTFGAPVDFATIIASSRKLSIPADTGRMARVYISAGAYRTATKDLVYAVWPDLSGEVGCTSGLGPGASAASTCKTRIWFGRSTDGGATWEAPVMLHNQASLNDQFYSKMAVDETDGKLVVVYYDTVNDPARIKTDVWMQSSFDDGVTWSTPVQLTSAETDETAASADGGNQYGDYIGVTGNAGAFFACWTDRRSGAKEEIWGVGFTLTDMATAIADSGNFGSVCLGSFADELLTINNTGSGPLSISNITSSSPDFLAPSVLSYPLIVGSGDWIDVVIRFQPTGPGAKSATITLISDDPAGPHIIKVSGDAPPPRLCLVVTNTGNFGKVCVGSYVDEPLVLNNSGRCALSITGITSSSGEFLIPQVLSYPLTIAAGDALSIPIRFGPTSSGAKVATITVTSNDPTGSHKVTISGDGQTPRLSLITANAGSFGKVCLGSFADEPLILNNSGPCTLSISGITSSSVEFLVPQVLSYPLTIAAGNSLPAPIRFAPTSFGPKSATITVTSNDPAGTHTISVSGDAPAGKLAVSGSLCFGGVKACCRAERTLTICNVGDCSLRVTSVAFKRKSRHWKLINNPFPATLHPGSCLGVVIRYKATEKCPVCSELVITSDDPITPVKTLDVMAYTIWNSCGCRQCCDDCRKGCCNKVHTEYCCEGSADDCCQDEEDDDHR